jgi:hypothetical protein
VDGNGPQTTRHSFARNDDFIMFEDFHLILVEDGNAIVIAELS